MHNNSILIMHRFKKGDEYYVFPGGTVKKHEKLEDAAKREIFEETSIDIAVKKLLYKVSFNHSEAYYYLCDYITGEPALGDYNELKDMRAGKDNFYEPLWFPIDQLKKIPLLPLEVRNWIIEDYKNGFSNEVREASLEYKKLRDALKTDKI